MSISLRDVSRVQQEFDRAYWSAPSDRMGKERHVFLHLVTLVGKLARVEERQEHDEPFARDVVREAIADLIVHAAQLAELRGIDLTESYVDRLRSLAEKKSPSDPFRGSDILREALSGSAKGEATGRP